MTAKEVLTRMRKTFRVDLVVGMKPVELNPEQQKAFREWYDQLLVELVKEFLEMNPTLRLELLKAEFDRINLNQVVSDFFKNQSAHG